jgi:very-short-patch-repair endonuclease
VLTAPIKTVKRARALRKKMSLPEVLLWRELRRSPGGFKFRRQCPQDCYILDFACLETRTAVEVDGEGHSFGDQPEWNARRDFRLQELGFTMFRIPARDVLQGLEGVLNAVVEKCRAMGPLHPPAAPGGPPPRSGEDL